ncbi:MAG: FAD-dependent oxidoreductase [Deltaproteobacteria bacterium]|nr:FAD-dependent oxidoreductase [Deltaproteobacteria bacterium]
MSSRFTKILEPTKIGRIEVKNRVAMAPMGIVGLLDLDGSPGERAIDYYIERARGGVGLIITSLFKVENEIDHFAGIPIMITPQATARFAELAEAVHALGTKIFVQLTAGFGRVITPRRLKGLPVSASEVPYYWNPDIICREIKTEEVERIVERFGVAAKILVAAGVDGIELHGHEGYLFDQFTTRIWNKRTDHYGGDLAGRLRLPIEALREIRKKVGQDFPVQYRFGLKHYIKGLNKGALPGEEYTEAGRDVEEGLEMAKMLESAGFDALHVDAGCYDSWYWPHPPAYQAHGCMVDMAADVKKVVGIPVTAVGRLEEPALAEKVLKDGKADMIALGRGLLSDPFWVRKVEKGRPEEIRPCIGCSDGCLGRIFSGRPISCAVNPVVGRERTYALQKTDKPKKILIAGGGIAGLEAARAATLRGLKVVLCEKSGAFGGHVISAGVPPFKKDLQRLLRWYESGVQGLDVDLRLGCEVTPDLVNSEKADVVIVATGAKPIVPAVPGIDIAIVATAPEILLGTKQPGDRVIVVGGGLIGCETAVWLAQQGKRVTLVEVLNDLMAGGLPVPHVNRKMVMDMLAFNRVTIMTGTRLLEVSNEGALFRNSSSKEVVLQGDTLVLSLGLAPNQRLYRSLQGNTPNLYLIGDAREARNIMGAVWDAYEVVRAI